MDGPSGFETFKELPAGYPRLAALVDSDENFMQYRRFGFLQARLLLYKQDELCVLESVLDDMEANDELNQSDILKSRGRDDTHVGKRKVLMEKIDNKFTEYGTQCPVIPRIKAASEKQGYYQQFRI